jgi:hypothetical protein
MACGSPIRPNASHALEANPRILILQGLDEVGDGLRSAYLDPTPHTPHERTAQSTSCRAWVRWGMACGSPISTQRLTRRLREHSPIHILQGFGMRWGMACGSPISPLTPHTPHVRTYPILIPAGLRHEVGDGLRVAYSDPTPHTPQSEHPYPHPAGLRHERGDGLRVAYPTQRLTRRRANIAILILQGLA